MVHCRDFYSRWIDSARPIDFNNVSILSSVLSTCITVDPSFCREIVFFLAKTQQFSSEIHFACWGVTVKETLCFYYSRYVEINRSEAEIIGKCLGNISDILDCKAITAVAGRQIDGDIILFAEIVVHQYL